MSVREQPLYGTWLGMTSRCHNPKNKAYADYGGRGIKVCDRWRESFWRFAADMVEKPVGKTLDRIDNDGNYEPSNVRWATPVEQLANSRSKNKPHYLTHDGETHHISEWARRRGTTVQAVSVRLRRGWSPLEALTIPFRPRSLRSLITGRK